VYVLGIDPGLTRCGYACLELGSGRVPVARAMGVLTTTVGDSTPSRLAVLQADLSDLMDELNPDVVVVEHVFFQTNVRTAISVAQASGLALAEAARRGCTVVQYTANQVKLTICGFGAADKKQVTKMVQTRLKLAAPPKPADAADAAALALTHLTVMPYANRMRSSVSAPSVGLGNGPRSRVAGSSQVRSA
jgi:crossover junction endodeoxyribonuclease RuvC